MFEQDQENNLIEEPEESQITEEADTIDVSADTDVLTEEEIPAEIEASTEIEESTVDEVVPDAQVAVDAEVDVDVEPEVGFEAPVDPDVTASVSDGQDDVLPSEPYAEIDDNNWYVVHCYSGYENKVHHNLMQRIESMGMQDMIFDVVVPTEEEIEVKEGKRRTVERRVFPGYILVNMLLTEESWYVVRNTPGVTGFVGMGNEPIPLRPEEVAHIVKRMEADAPRIKVTFRLDERVRIIEGPFKDFHGTVSELDMERAKVRVMVNFFGRETPVELDFLQVEKM